MKKVKKMGTGGLPAGAPEMGGGFKRPMPAIGPAKGRPMQPTPTPMPGATRPPAVKGFGGQIPGTVAAPTPGGIARRSISLPPPGTTRPMMKKGGKVSSASKRADGIATKGKTKGRTI